MKKISKEGMATYSSVNCFGKRSYHNVEGYLAYCDKKIVELLNNNKFSLAKKICEDILDYVYYDKRISMYLAMILKNEQKYKEAVSVLEDIDDSEKDSSVINKQVLLYAKLNDVEKMYNLYTKFYCCDFDFKDVNKYYNNLDTYRTAIYLKKKFDKNFIINTNILFYIDKMLYQYNYDVAEKHIMLRDDNVSILPYLKDIENIISNSSNGILNENFSDYYYFCLNNECFKVSSIVNTGNILDVCLVNDVVNRDICYLEDIEKVKVKTGIERFRKRYDS